MTLLDFICPACGRVVIGATLKEVWYSAHKPCCSPDCKRRADDALRGVKAIDLMREGEREQSRGG